MAKLEEKRRQGGWGGERRGDVETQMGKELSRLAAEERGLREPWNWAGSVQDQL